MDKQKISTVLRRMGTTPDQGLKPLYWFSLMVDDPINLFFIPNTSDPKEILTSESVASFPPLTQLSAENTVYEEVQLTDFENFCVTDLMYYCRSCWAEGNSVPLSKKVKEEAKRFLPLLEGVRRKVIFRKIAQAKLSQKEYLILRGKNYNKEATISESKLFSIPSAQGFTDECFVDKEVYCFFQGTFPENQLLFTDNQYSPVIVKVIYLDKHFVKSANFTLTSYVCNAEDGFLFPAYLQGFGSIIFPSLGYEDTKWDWKKEPESLSLGDAFQELFDKELKGSDLTLYNKNMKLIEEYERIHDCVENLIINLKQV